MLRNGIQSVLTVKPSSAIRADYKKFSMLCHELDEPVLVTNNGENDLIVMSHEAFCRREAAARLKIKLLAAERQIVDGSLRSHEEVFARLRERVNGA